MLAKLKSARLLVSARAVLLVFGLLAALITAGCDPQASPVTFTVSVPAPNEVAFQANLKEHFNFGLGGSYELPENIGTITLTPDTPEAGLGLGFRLNTRAFLKETWVDFREVTTLPTGAAFPSWLSGGVVDIYVPKLNTKPVDFHFYLGVHSQFYVGVAGVIRAIDENFPAINIGYSFYDKSGNVVLGLYFFGPKLGQGGHATVPGGIFIGTNLTPLLPAPGQDPKPEQLDALFELGQRALEGKPVKINGQTVVGEIRVSGQEAERYRSPRKVRAVIDRYLHASRHL